jgi:hypothetical protein
MEEQKNVGDTQAAKKRSRNGAGTTDGAAHTADEGNGQHSTDSRVPDEDGKRSPYIYGKGLFAAHLVRIGPEAKYDHEAYLQLADCVRNHYRPVGFMEQFMVEKIVVEMVRCARVFGHEQRRLGYYDGAAQLDIPLILRYSIAADRQLSHSIKELERMQTERKRLSETSKAQGRKNGPVASILHHDLSVFRLSSLVDKKPESTQGKVTPRSDSAKNPKLRNEPKSSDRTNGKGNEDDKPHNRMG